MKKKILSECEPPPPPPPLVLLFRNFSSSFSKKKEEEEKDEIFEKISVKKKGGGWVESFSVPSGGGQKPPPPFLKSHPPKLLLLLPNPPLPPPPLLPPNAPLLYGTFGSSSLSQGNCSSAGKVFEFKGRKLSICSKRKKKTYTRTVSADMAAASLSSSNIFGDEKKKHFLLCFGGPNLARVAAADLLKLK